MARMDAVLYIRVSTDEQVAGTSLTSQEDDCRAFCKRNSYTVTRLFADRGESAKTEDRPQFLALIAHCQKYKPAAVVVWKFDRWARNSQDHAIYSASISKSGTRLLSATEPIEDNPSGRLMETILSAVAQFDNEVRAERAKRSMKEVAQRGGWVAHAPFGFKCCRTESNFPILIQHPEKAPIVIDLFNGIAEGRRTTAQTVSLASEFGILPNACWLMLRKPIYAGFMRGASTDHREVQAAFPGLISRDTWQRVQDILNGRSHNRGRTLTEREEFPLRSLMLCEVCGEPITASWSKGRSKSYAYYHCHQGHVRVKAEVVHQDWTDLLVRNSTEFIPILHQLKDRTKHLLLERVHLAEQVNGNALDNQKRITTQRARLLELHLSGDITVETFREKDRDLAARYASISTHTETVIDWVGMVDDCVAKAVMLFEDPVAIWARCPLIDRQRFCSALYSGKLVLGHSGLVEPQKQVGLTGLIRDLVAPKIEMVGLTVRLSNLLASIRAIQDLAA